MCPTGFSPRRNLRAKAWFTSATRGALGPSRSVMSRPARQRRPERGYPPWRDAVEHRQRRILGNRAVGEAEALGPVDWTIAAERRSRHLDASAPHRAAERRHDRDARRFDARNRQNALPDVIVGRRGARPARGRRAARRSRRAARDRDRTRAAPESAVRTTAGTGRRRRRAPRRGRPGPRPARWRPSRGQTRHCSGLGPSSRRSARRRPRAPPAQRRRRAPRRSQ